MTRAETVKTTIINMREIKKSSVTLTSDRN